MESRRENRPCDKIQRIKGVRLPCKDACQLLKCSRWTLMRWTAQGKIICEKSSKNGRLFFTITRQTPHAIASGALSTLDVLNILCISRPRLTQLIKEGVLAPIHGIKPRQFLLSDVLDLKESRKRGYGEYDLYKVPAIADLLDNDKVSLW